MLQFDRDSLIPYDLSLISYHFMSGQCDLQSTEALNLTLNPYDLTLTF